MYRNSKQIFNEAIRKITQYIITSCDFFFLAQSLSFAPLIVGGQGRWDMTKKEEKNNEFMRLNNFFDVHMLFSRSFAALASVCSLISARTLYSI